MAKHKEAKQPSMTGEEIATRGETSMAEVVSHMRIVDFEAFDEKYNSPAFLQALGVNQEEWQEAPSTIELRDPQGNKVVLPPMADFDTQEAPCMIRGGFDSLVVLNFGGRTQNVWTLIAPNGERVGLWGSTVLDRKMFAMNPDKGADTVIVYLGDTPTSRGLNPAKIFRTFCRKAATTAIILLSLFSGALACEAPRDSGPIILTCGPDAP